MKIFSGSSNQPLAKKIAKILKTRLGKLEIIRFGDSECRVRLQENVRNQKVFVIQSVSPPCDENLIELCLIGNSLKYAQAKEKIVVIPYLAYARQDKVHRKGEPLSAKMVVKFLEKASFDKAICLDLHSEIVAGFFDVPLVHLDSTEIFKEKIKSLGKNALIVAPDAGGGKRSAKFSEKLNLPLVFIEKRRALTKIHQSESLQVIGNVKGKIAIIVDDLISSGQTLIHAAKLLKKAGAKKVYAFVTHTPFIEKTKKNLEKSVLDGLVVTDSINLPKKMKIKGMEIVSTAPLLVKEIRKEISNF